MASVQVRIPKEVVAEASAERRALGFSSDEPIGTVVSELVRDGMEYRRRQQLERERDATYAAWAEDAELRENLRQTVQWSIEARST
jgi:hypothetical protein